MDPAQLTAFVFVKGAVFMPGPLKRAYENPSDTKNPRY